MNALSLAKLLDNRVAVITGASAGMGAETAKLFAEQGAKVVVADVDESLGAATVEEIRKEGDVAAFVHCDVSNEDEVSNLIESSVRLFGRVDCAVNNAGVGPELTSVEDIVHSQYENIMRVNVWGVLNCMKFQIRQMKLQGVGGTIVNTGSVSSVRPQANTAIYTASKHAVIGLTKAVALDVASCGIRVNAVLPGAIDTPMLRAALQRSGRNEADYAPALSLFNRFGTGREVANAHLYLSSDLSSYTTGHALAVEAGYLSR